MAEVHVDALDSALFENKGTFSVRFKRRMDADGKPLRTCDREVIVLGQDESIFKKHMMTGRSWFLRMLCRFDRIRRVRLKLHFASLIFPRLLASFTFRLNWSLYSFYILLTSLFSSSLLLCVCFLSSPFLGDGIMVSAFTSRRFGFGKTFTEVQLGIVNRERRSQRPNYSCEEAALAVHNASVKVDLESSPFVRQFYYGGGESREGWWNSDHMCVQMEDVPDVKATHLATRNELGGSGGSARNINLSGFLFNQ